MIKAILFDFDGTMVDSLKHHLYAWKKAFLKTGVELLDDEIIKNVFYRHDDDSKDSKYTISDERLEIYYEHLEEAFQDLEKHEHLDEFLDYLAENKIKMAIISFADGKRIRIHLKRLGLDKYFQFVLGAEDVKKLKPDPEIANVSMERLNVIPKETLLIGDTNWDILTGKNAGTKTALFVPESNLKFIDLDAYRQTNPDIEFADFSELKKQVEEL